MNSVGKRIAELREVLGFTQADLAKGIGTDQGTISKIECGKGGLSLDRAVAIAKFMRVPIENFVSVRKGRK